MPRVVWRTTSLRSRRDDELDPEIDTLCNPLRLRVEPPAAGLEEAPGVAVVFMAGSRVPRGFRGTCLQKSCSLRPSFGALPPAKSAGQVVGSSVHPRVVVDRRKPPSYVLPRSLWMDGVGWGAGAFHAASTATAV